MTDWGAPTVYSHQMIPAFWRWLSTLLGLSAELLSSENKRLLVKCINAIVVPWSLRVWCWPGSNSDFKARPFNGIVCSMSLKWMALGSTSPGRTGFFSVQKGQYSTGLQGQGNQGVKCLFSLWHFQGEAQSDSSDGSAPVVKGRWQKSISCLALLISFLPLNSLLSSSFQECWVCKQRDGIDLWGSSQKSWSKVVTVGKVSSPGLSLALANCPVPKAMGKEPSGSY